MLLPEHVSYLLIGVLYDEIGCCFSFLFGLDSWDIYLHQAWYSVYIWSLQTYSNSI